MPRQWTPAQSAAIVTSGRTLLVSAAAGAGKTATLTERIIRRLTDTEHPADLSRMLIVTFTRAAAAELRTRISEALSDAIALHPENRRLQKQLLDLGGAHISTIDSFCYEPVKAHFAETGLPASFRIADEAELRPLSERVMDGLIDEFFDKYAHGQRDDDNLFSLLSDNPFADLLDALSQARGDDTLAADLRDLYDRLLAFPSGIRRLLDEADALTAAADRDFFDTPQGAVVRGWLNDLLCEAESFYDEADAVFLVDEKAKKAYSAAFWSDRETIDALRAANTYADVRGILLNRQPERLKANRDPSEAAVYVKEKRTRFNAALKTKFKEGLFAADPADIRAEILRTAEMCRVLYDFLSAYDERITQEKTARGICDFTDNRRNLLKMLTDAEGNPSALAEEYREAFDEVYIDEYQDVDEVQDTIFRLIGGDHRFMVGDIKQSIYGFRGADPTVFAGYRRTLPVLDPTAPAGIETAETAPDAPTGRCILMSENFRCDESVIRVTNAVSRLMFAACPSVGYTRADDLVFGKRVPDGYVCPPVQVDVLYEQDAYETENETENADVSGEDADASGHAVEYRHVANRIAALLRSGTTLADGRPVTPGDIAILARSKSGYEGLSEALAAAGIPFGSEEIDAETAGRDVLHGPEMKYLVNLLRVLDDPDSDVPLCEVLRAPFPGFSLSEVIRLRGTSRDAGNLSLYASVCACAASADESPDGDGASDPARTDEENGNDPARPAGAVIYDPTASLPARAAAFVAWIDKYRTLCHTLPAVGVLRLLRQDRLVAGRTSRAFLYLYDAARTAAPGTFTGVYSFLRFFERKLETTHTLASDPAAKANAVSFMTIHGSKGLEFPVVFLVDCGRSFPAKSARSDLLFDKSTGVSLKLYDRASHRKYNTALRSAAALGITLGEREDEMRLLYVAMTRARERLIITGLGKEEEPLPILPGDRFSTLSVNNYLGWIRPALAAAHGLEPFVELRTIPLSSVVPCEPLPRDAAALTDETHTAAADFYRRMQVEAPVQTEAEQLARSVPTKVPASRMAKDLLDTCVFFRPDGLSPSDPAFGSGDDSPETADAQTIESIRASIRLMETCENNEFEVLLSGNRKPTAAERGTATHLFLQFCDYKRTVRDGLDAEIARLLSDGFINARTAEIVDRDQLRAFFSSRFFAGLASAERIEREFRFARFVPMASLTSNPALAAALGDRTLYVQGSIDLLAIYPDGSIVLCDYKTDRLTPDERDDPSLLRAHLTERHGPQLAQYAAAVRETFGTAPSRVCVYSLPLGEAVEIDI